MSRFWVLDRLFKARAVGINWPDEKGALGYEGPEQPFEEDASLHFRWLLHPALGLPREPFMIWRNRHPGGQLTTQDLADLPDWELIETVGLPVDDDWGDAGYDLSDQGPVNDPRRPVDAAQRRLDRGAPRIGWTKLRLNLPDGQHELPEWQPVDLRAYLEDMLEGRLMTGVHAMLRDVPNGLDHRAFVDAEADVAGTGAINPHLLLDGAVALRGRADQATSEWHPLGLLLLGAGSDPLASLALGFGTAMPQRGERDDLYMVSTRLMVELPDASFEIQLADVITVDGSSRAPERPSDLSTALIGHTRPQRIDGPSLDSIGVRWKRALNPAFALGVGDETAAVGYAVGRLAQEAGRDGAILLARRPEHVGGWLPFVASKPPHEQPVQFTDQRRRETTANGELVGDPMAYEHVYGVAAQDVFGRWSPWSTVAFEADAEAPQTPSILAVALDGSGVLTVDFGWDWSDRTPELVELTAAYSHDPGSPVLSAVARFGGDAEPSVTGAEIVPLDHAREPLVSWGAAQDPDPSEPGTRYYRLTAEVFLDFGGERWRELEVRACGQCHLHERFIPGWNIGPFGPPSRTRVYDPGPPRPPAVPEAPQWASLPDAAGVSRARLSWPGDPHVAGYALYEATETSLLAALGLPGPDPARSLVDRLATLRGQDLPRHRSAFRRVQKELIPPGAPYEVSLPRGSTVLHLYAVTAVSRNQVESAWPSSGQGFIAVAAPRLAVPSAPILEAFEDTDPETIGPPPVVQVRVRAAGGPAVELIELYRIADDGLAADVDTMGAPIVALAGAQATFFDHVGYGWHRVWYRAVAWSVRDDLQGVVEARSRPSAPVSVLIPPPGAPRVTDLRVNEPGSTATDALISWTTSAPIGGTAIGAHAVVAEARANAGAPASSRTEAQLDALPAVASAAELPAPDPAAPRIVRVGPAGAFRLYAWLPRPAAGQAFAATVKVIDPLGRVGRLDAGVPAPP
jgi:hypothetical protein